MKGSILKTKKSFKEIYDENRLLYAEKKFVEDSIYDPSILADFLDGFYAKRRTQRKMRIYLFALSCFLTTLIVFGIIEAINSLMQ